MQAVVATRGAEAAREARAAAEVLEASEHPQLGHELLGAVQDRRAGEAQAESVRGQPLRELERRLGAPGPGVLHVVRLVQDQRAQAARGEPRGVGLEDVVVQHHDVGLRGIAGPGVGGAAVEHGHRAVGQPDVGLTLPRELHARGAHHRRRERLVVLQRGQRLHGLAESLLVGDEGAPALQRVAHAGALERMQHAAELEPVELRVLRVGERNRGRRPLVLGHELRDHRPDALVEVHLRVGGHELGEVGGQRRVGGHGDAPRRVAHVEAARPGDRVSLGQLAELARGLRVPDGEDRDLGLAVVAHLDAELGRRGLASRRQLPGAAAGQVVELHAVELVEQVRVLHAEREKVPAVGRVGRLVQLRRSLAGQRAQDEGTGTAVGHHRDHRTPAIRVREPGPHLGGGLESREAVEHALHRLGHARVGRNAPVLRAPVEPALGQTLDRVVQLFVDREVEDDLDVARIVVEQPHPSTGGTLLCLLRIGHQTIQVSHATGRTREISVQCPLPAGTAAAPADARTRRAGPRFRLEARPDTPFRRVPERSRRSCC